MNNHKYKSINSEHIESRIIYIKMYFPTSIAQKESIHSEAPGYNLISKTPLALQKEIKTPPSYKNSSTSSKLYSPFL